ncbi:MAG: response regulator [Oscillospiraceae bacterium]|jgi:signal transduction histidine kinase/CheY-like chemotaxis protein|nr:response regulator [Oscillospiraceae bacterium]
MSYIKVIKANFQQVIFVCVTLLLIVLISIITVNNTVDKKTILAVNVALEEAEKTIRSYLREPQIAYDTIYNTVKNELDRGDSQEYVATYLKETTNSYKSQDSNISGFLGVYGYIRGEFISGSDFIPGDDYVPQQSPWYQTAIMNEKAEYSVPYTDADTGNTVISLSQEIYGQNGEYYGVLAMDIDTSWLSSYVENLQFVEGGYGLIIDQYMSVLVHPNKNNVSLQLQAISPGYAQIADTLRTENEINTKHEYHIDGQKALAFFKELYNGWRIGVVLPKTSFYSDVYTVTIVLSIIGIISMVVLNYILLTLSVAKLHSEQENKSKSSFLATMSHEIRTPINAIIGVSQIALMKEDLSESITEDFTKIEIAGNNLLGIINDILDFSKIENGKLDINPTLYDLPSLINDAVQLNITRIQSKPIEFFLEPAPDLFVNMRGDELRIKQILNNILSNAFKYTDKGSVTLAISCTREGETIWLTFRVSDTGQGMTEENVRKLFDEYSRFNEDANRATEGTGLGMNITNRLIEMMGGKIDVESVPGAGSTFTVTIKQDYYDGTVIGEELAEKLRKFEFVANKAKKHASVVYADMSYGKVLIVDDVETNLFVAQGIMSPYKLNIETADSGFETLEKVESGSVYDIIFMDHMMPKMDGIETTKLLREAGYSKPIVALTANAVVGNDKMFKENGFDDFISKPIDVRQLNAVLNKLVRDAHKGEIIDIAELTETSREPVQIGVSEKLTEIFRRDATKAIVALRETARNGDLQLFATTVHAMKSACANIGENELSELAKELELAGKSGDIDFIRANAENFVARLEAFVKPENAVDESGLDEDTELLREKLNAIKSAVDEFDDSAARKILSELKTLKWKNKTLKLFEKIDELLLHSDFDEVMEAIDEWI